MGKIILSEGEDVQQGGVSSVSLRKGGVFNLRLNTPVVQATSLFRKRNSEPLTAPSAEARFRACGHDQRTAPVWRLYDRPLEAFTRSLFKLYGNPALAGRGGSVNRRDHNLLARNRAQLTGAYSLQKKPTQTPATLRERGSGGEALLFREAASPRISPTKISSGGSAREGASL